MELIKKQSILFIIIIFFTLFGCKEKNLDKSQNTTKEIAQEDIIEWEKWKKENNYKYPLEAFKRPLIIEKGVKKNILKYSLDNNLNNGKGEPYNKNKIWRDEIKELYKEGKEYHEIYSQQIHSSERKIFYWLDNKTLAIFEDQNGWHLGKDKYIDLTIYDVEQKEVIEKIENAIDVNHRIQGWDHLKECIDNKYYTVINPLKKDVLNKYNIYGANYKDLNSKLIKKNKIKETNIKYSEDPMKCQKSIHFDLNNLKEKSYGSIKDFKMKIKSVVYNNSVTFSYYDKKNKNINYINYDNIFSNFIESNSLKEKKYFWEYKYKSKNNKQCLLQDIIKNNNKSKTTLLKYCFGENGEYEISKLNKKFNLNLNPYNILINNSRITGINNKEKTYYWSHNFFNHEKVFEIEKDKVFIFIDNKNGILKVDFSKKDKFNNIYTEYIEVAFISNYKMSKDNCKIAYFANNYDRGFYISSRKNQLVVQNFCK